MDEAESRRWQALDLFKALALLPMIAIHVQVWWFFADDKTYLGPPAGMTPEAARLFLDGIFRPFFRTFGTLANLFPVAAGAALRFALDPWWDGARGGLKDDCGPALWKVAIRATCLAALGFSINLLTWGPDGWSSWDVLPFVGLSSVVASLVLARSSVRALLLGGACAVFFAPSLRGMTWLAGDSYWRLALLGSSSGDHFYPFFPWFGCFAYGLWLGHMKRSTAGPAGRTFFKSVLGLGLALTSVGVFSGDFLLSFDPSNIWGPTVFQPSTAHIIGQLGAFTLVMALLDLRPTAPAPRYGWRSVLSRGILAIYAAHIIFGYRLTDWLNGSGSLWGLAAMIAGQLVAAYAVGAAAVWLRDRSRAGAPEKPGGHRGSGAG